MKYVGLELTPRRGSFNAVDEVVASADGVTRESVLDVEHLSDGSSVLLVRLRGDPAGLSGALEAHDGVRSFDVTDGDGEAFDLFVHADEGEPLSQLLSVADDHALLIERPVEFTDTGAYVTVAGESDQLRAAFESVPDSVRARIQRAGEYAPGEGAALSTLTDRQREALETAHELGYYANPRGATCADVAEQLGCSKSTASELIRRAEAGIVSTLLDR